VQGKWAGRQACVEARTGLSHSRHGSLPGRSRMAHNRTDYRPAVAVQERLAVLEVPDVILPVGERWLEVDGGSVGPAPLPQYEMQPAL
jgi:hypothetical protein